MRRQSVSTRDRTQVDPPSRTLLAVSVGVAGIVLAGVAAGNWIPPLNALVLVLWVLFLIAVISTAKLSPLSLFSRFMVVVYCLPFAVLTEYVFVPTPEYALSMPKIQELVADRALVAFIALIGAVGLCGLTVGLRLSDFGRRQKVHRDPHRPLPFGFFALLIVCTVGAFLVSGPTETIFSASYIEIASGEAKPIVSGVAFGGLGYVVYIVLLALWLDLEYSPRGRGRLIRMILWYASFAFVVVVLNLLRGGRGVTGLLLAIGALVLAKVPPGGLRDLNWKLAFRRIRWIAPIAALTYIVFYEVGEARANLVTGDYRPFEQGLNWVLASYKQGSWMGSLLSCFGMADEYLKGQMVFLWGRTYMEYFLSLPPSLLADLVHYTRPINDTQGPAYWYQGYTVGGIHPVVVPFVNYGPFGVLFIMSAFGFILGRVERWSLRTDFTARLLYGSAFIGSVHWFWYGDMYIVRAFMTGVLVDWFIKVLRQLVPQSSGGLTSVPRSPRVAPAR